MDKDDILRRFRQENAEGDERAADAFHEAWATAGMFCVGLAILIWVLCLWFSGPMLLRDAMWLFLTGAFAVYHGVRYLRLKERDHRVWLLLFSFAFVWRFVMFLIDLGGFL